MKKRQTRQLAATLDVLMQSLDHPTAEQVHERVRRRLRNVSLGTIYRNLEKLQKEGRAVVLHVDGGVARYDGRVDRHDHFLCDGCGLLADLSPTRFSARAKLVHRGFHVRAATTVYYGLCPRCAAEQGSALARENTT